MTFDLEQTDRLLQTTRAVRKRLDLDRPVERSVVLDCLRLAIQAPSGGNSQPWRWIVIDDQPTKDALAGLYREAYAPYIASRKAELAAQGGNADHPIAQSSDYLAEHLEEVPVMVIPCLLGRVTADDSPGHVAGFFGSVMPAVWSFMLALRSRGLGSAFTTLHLEREKEAAALLGVPDTVTQLALLPVAYTKGDDFRPADRKPVEDVTYWNGWRQRG
ncbi:MAG: putative oxidoreductase [Acidimicrobiales bacterium]|nr:putative oxidoreductase [Acidimicrobiales bacterium]